MKKNCFTPIIAAILATSINQAAAQSFSTQERFQDLFVTAGYGTAFGAAMGAALLSFQDRPDESLRYVAIGASLGFITGSLLGSYIVFSPVFQTDTPQTSRLPLALTDSQATFTVRPTIDPHASQLSRLEGVWTISRF